MDTDEIIAAIKNRCIELGLTQAQLANRAAISPKTLYSFLSERHDLGWRKLNRIFDSLDLSFTIKPGKGRPTESELAGIFGDDEE